MAKDKRYFILILLVSLMLFNGVNVVYGADVLRYDNLSNGNPNAVCSGSVGLFMADMQPNQKVSKIVFLKTLGGSSVSIQKIDGGTYNVVESTTSPLVNKGFAFNFGGTDLYYYEFYPNLTLNNNYLYIPNISGDFLCYSGSNIDGDNYDVFNQSYFSQGHFIFYRSGAIKVYIDDGTPPPPPPPPANSSNGSFVYPTNSLVSVPDNFLGYIWSITGNTFSSVAPVVAVGIGFPFAFILGKYGINLFFNRRWF
jgi:hypothetical protein